MAFPLAIVAAVTSLASGIAGAVGRERAAGRSRDFARQMAEDVIAQGERQAEFAAMDLRRLRGQQTTAMAAQGIDIGQGTAAEIARQTEEFGQQDIEQMRMNAAREAWGIRTQANLNYRAERNAAIAGGIKAVADFAGTNAGRTMLTRPVDAWRSFQARRQVTNAIGSTGRVTGMR